MSNHSSDPNDPVYQYIHAKLTEALKPTKLGPTGDHPNGRITPTDEGGIQFAVASKGNVVMLDFGKPVVWVGMPSEQARGLAALLVKHADIVDGKDEQRRLELERTEGQCDPRGDRRG